MSWLLLRLVIKDLTFACPSIASINVNDDQQDVTILAHLFIPNQVYMFRGDDP